MSPVSLDCRVACLALALCKTSTVHTRQPGGVESVWDRSTCELLFLSLLPGLMSLSKARRG